MCIRQDRGHPTPCKIFTGRLNNKGYGQIQIGSRVDGTNRVALVHRVAYEHHRGAIPDGASLDHLCSQPDCCDEMHLDPVEHVENVRRGRSVSASRQRAAAKTHCKHGHPFSGENLRIHVTPDGREHRKCRTCERARFQH